MHHALAEEAGVPDLIVQNGIIYAWCKHADFEAEEKFGDLRKSQGISWTELSQVELCRMEPELSSEYPFGSRPSLPDCLPVISASSKVNGLLYAFGHGYIGLSVAPETARRVGEMICGNQEADIDPFFISRFHKWFMFFKGSLIRRIPREL